MKKQVLKFKAEYASEVMNTIPAGYINKSICGCGLTTVALENDENIIIAVPTIYLAINKSEQYPNERCSHNILAVWGDTKQEDIDNYITNNKVLKIMVTYDGLSKVESLLTICKLVIDESDQLLSMTKGGRSNSAKKLFEIAEQYKETVSFISATPTDLKYMPEWISEINQVTIEWENTVKSIPILCERTYPFKSLKEEFILPLKNNNSLTVASKTFSKVIVFINSITQIAEIVKTTELDKKECGIICGNSLKNDVKVIGIKRYNKGTLPKYLFVTSSGFSGIDLSDESAMTIVVSNTAETWQMIDMLTDLKQAVSRQRNKKNPNYGSYIYIYNQSLFKLTKEELLDKIDFLYKKIENAIILQKIAIDNDIASGFEPSNDFITYTYKSGDYYIINEDAFMADKYFILEVREQYSKGFDISAGFEVFEVVPPIELPNNTTYRDLVRHFNELNENGVVDWGWYSSKTEWISLIEASYRFYKTAWVDYNYAKQMVNNYGDTYKLVVLQISKLFKVGTRYTRKEVKAQIQDVYNTYGVIRKATHTDLSEAYYYKEKMINGTRLVEITGKNFKTI